MVRLPRFTVLLCAAAALGWLVPAWAQSVTFNGTTYVNKGLVGVGRVNHDQRDRVGETFGSLSGLALDLASWKRTGTGTFTATLYAQPDRGYVKAGVTTNYRPRRHKFSLTFIPNANGSSRQDQLTLSLSETVLLTESNGTSLTSLDPTATGSATRAGFPALPQAFNSLVSIDAEGLALLPDGTFFVSDEYGPYLFRFSAAGALLGAVRPPEALVPKRNGADSFSSDSPPSGQSSPSPSQPATGRANNKGLEGLAVSADGRTLYTMMQSATRQDGDAGANAQNRHARLLAYDVTNPAAPSLTREWVLPLPLYTDSSNNQQVAAQHDIVALSATQFLVLATDGNGRGSDSTRSLFRKVLLYDVSTATNIAGRTEDSTTTPIAANGILAGNLTPATSAALIDLNDVTQLTKFGLNNSASDNSDTLSAGWESLALAPALDATTPDDFFLLIGNDNDFSTGSGFQDGKSYSASPNIDTMVLAYRLTLPGTLAAPSIITAPANTAVSLGQAATFTVTASGSPAPTFQWSKNGTAIAGATSASLTISSVQAADAGAYTVTLTNANGTITSAAASLTVNGANSPVFTAQPSSQTVASGSTVVFQGSATNSPSYQWRFNGRPIAGATSRLLVLTGVTTANVGTYTVAATNTSGTASSADSALTVVDVSAADNGRIINLSILTALTAGETMTMGTALGGAGTSGAKALLARGAGPALAQLGVAAFLPDPTITLNFTGTNPASFVGSNDNWGGDAGLKAAFNAVGAFNYAADSSKDAAIFRSGSTALATGNYTVQVRDTGSGTGTMIAELYDATPSASFTATTPRLINVSVLKTISATGSLTAGFYVGGTTARTVLIRAIGPGLASVGVTSGTLVDPQLTLFNSTQTAIATNNDWGGDSQLTSAGSRVGAFSVSNPASKDAMLLVTLPAGLYTAQMSPVTGTAGGLAIVEIYEVP